MAALITDLRTGGLQASPAQHSKGFVAIFAVSFVAFLLIALVAEVLTLRWRSWWPGAESENSLIGGVKAAVYTFMSYLY
jgi:light-harvesting complex 1 beta chain